MEIGQRLIRLRKQRKMSQQTIADLLNIARSTYAGYELGVREMNYDTLRNLSDIYDVSTDFILGKTDHPVRVDKVDYNNAKELLTKSDLHWDGLPLCEEELSLIRDLLEVVVQQRIKSKSEEER